MKVVMSENDECFDLTVKVSGCEDMVLQVFPQNILSQVYEAIKDKLGFTPIVLCPIFENGISHRATSDGNLTMEEFGLVERKKLIIRCRSCEEASYFRAKRIRKDLTRLGIYNDDVDLFSAIEIKVLNSFNEKMISTFVMPNTTLKSIAEGVQDDIYLYEGYEITYTNGLVETKNGDMIAETFGLKDGSTLDICQKDCWREFYNLITGFNH